MNDVAWKKYALSDPIGPCVRRVWGTYHAGRISYLDVDPFEPSKCFGIEGRCVGAMFVLHPSAEIMLKFSYHHQVDGMVSLLLLLMLQNKKAVIYVRQGVLSERSKSNRSHLGYI